MAFERPFKLEIRKDGKKIAFGPRRPGEVGRDILAVKAALGLVTSPGIPESVTEPGPSVALDSQNWFDCGTGLGMDIRQASTYDARLRGALINFQIQNQFLIISYLLEKFGLRDAIGQVGADVEFASAPLNGNLPKEYDQSLIKMIESSVILFDSELGLLGEATLAILHGWVPHTTLFNSGYAHTYEKSPGSQIVYDVIHIALGRNLSGGKFTQSYGDLVNAGICTEGGYTTNVVEKLNTYLRYASDNTNWTRITGEWNPFVANEEEQRFQFATLEYVKKDPETVSSILYSATINVFENATEIATSTSVDGISSAERIENLKRMYFPDPFVDPAPFEIDEDKIGYFLETEYQLKAGSLPTEDQNTIRELEQKALEEVFQSYNKPQVWYLNRSAALVGSTNELEKNKISYFAGGLDPEPGHNGYYPYPDAIKSESDFEPDISFKKYAAYAELKRRLDFNTHHRAHSLDLFEEGNWLGRSESIVGAVFGPSGPAEEVDLGNWANDGRSRRLIREAYDSANSNITTALSQWPTQEYSKESFYVLSLKEDNPMISQELAEHWRQIDDVGTTQPLIRFIEYRTPSLRPNQKYRALFYLNRRKLEAIKNSIFRPSVQEDQSSDLGQEGLGTQDCADNNTKQSLRRYQEYKSHAIRTRNEIVKKFREESKKLQAADNFRSGRVDLGTYGPFDLNDAFNPLGGGMTSGMAHTEKIFSKLVGEEGSLLSGLGVTGTDMEQLESTIKNSDPSLVNNSGMPPGANSDASAQSSDSIKISLEDLKVRVKIISQDLNDAAEEIGDGTVTFEPGSNFDAKRESNYINQFSIEIEQVIFDGLGELGVNLDGEINESQTKITLNFATASNTAKIGPKVGKQITSIIVDLPGTQNESGSDTATATSSGSRQRVIQKFDGDQLAGLLLVYPIASRPRTVNYISRVYDMTTRYLPEGSIMKSFFEDSRGSCKDLGIDIKKTLGISYIGKYTSGLKSIAEKDNTAWEAVEKWADDSFISPFSDWISASGENLSKSDPRAKAGNDFFDEAAALKMMGEMCDWEDVYTAVFDKLDFASLLCDYLKCIKLPGFDIKLPSFYLPPLPKIPIIGWMGEIYKFLIEKMDKIINRLLCTVAKMLIDKMTIPFCEEQLREFIAAGSSAGPLWNQAFADSLLLTGITEGQKEQAKEFFEDSVSILTKDELCRLLKGQPLDRATTGALIKLVQNRGLDLALETEEDIINFFGVLYQYLPADLCDALERPELQIKDCEDPQDPVIAARNQLLSDDPNISEDELNRALDIAKKNRDDIAEQLKSFSGSDIDSLAPNFFEMGNPSAMVSDYPPYLKDQMNRSMSAIFEPARSSYITALSTFIPSMKILSPHAPRAGRDGDYEDIETMKLESAMYQLAAYTYYANALAADWTNSSANEIHGREALIIADESSLEFIEDQPDAQDDRARVLLAQAAAALTAFREILSDHYVWITTLATDLQSGAIDNETALANTAVTMPAFRVNAARTRDAWRAKYREIYEVRGPDTQAASGPISGPGYFNSDRSQVFFDNDNLDLPMPVPVPPHQYHSSKLATVWECVSSDPQPSWDDYYITEWGFNTWLTIATKSMLFLENPTEGTGYSGSRSNFIAWWDEINATRTDEIRARLAVNRARLNELKSPPPLTADLLSTLFLVFQTERIRDEETPPVMEHTGTDDSGQPQHSLVYNYHDVFKHFDVNDTAPPVLLPQNRRDGHLGDAEPAATQINYDSYIDSLLDPKDKKSFSVYGRGYQSPGRAYISTSGVLAWKYPTADTNDTAKRGAVIRETRDFWAEYEEEVPNSPKLTNMLASRVNFLSNQINEILQRRSTSNIELHLPYLKEAFKWQNEEFKLHAEDAANQQGEPQNFVKYDKDENELNLSFQAGVYSPSITMKEMERNGRFDRYDITVRGDFFLNQIPEDEVTFRYCDEVPQSATISRLVLGERTGNNFTKREAWASFLFDKMASQFGSNKRAKDLDDRDKTDILEKLSEKNFEQVTEKSMEQVMFSLYNSRFFDADYAENLDDRISGKPVYKQSCVSNRFGISEASVLSFDKVILGDPAAEIALESMKPENSPFNRDFDTPGPFEKALKTISVKAFIRACLIEILLKGGIAYASWDIEPIVSEKFFVDYVMKNIETELDNNGNLKDLWRKTMERSESISSSREALRTFVISEMMKMPNYSKEIFNPDQPKRDFFEWEVGDILPMVEPPSNLLSSGLRTFTSSGGRRDLPITRPGQRRFHIEEYLVITIPQETRDILGSINTNTPFPSGVYTIPFFRERFAAWYDEAKTLLTDPSAHGITMGMQTMTEEILHTITIKHRCRLMLLEAPPPSVAAAPKSPMWQTTARHFGQLSDLKERSKNVLKGYVSAKLTDIDGGIHDTEVITVDLARVERDISPSNCRALWQDNYSGQRAGAQIKILDSLQAEDTRRYMRKLLSESDDFQFVMNTVFPIRRFMSMASIYSTSILSGYSAVPDVMKSAKIMISTIAKIADTPRRLQDELVGINQSTFQDFIKKNFPSDPSDPSCIDFPGIGGDFFEKFFSDLWDLFKQLPSILLRGIAFQLEPGYKEMRTHYLNCDIEKLKIENLAVSTVDDKLVNGLRVGSGGHGNNNGKYASLYSMPIDLGHSFANPFKLPRRLEKTILKTMSYVYSGGAPFIDLNSVFKIPCLEIDKNYLENEKYDFGKYGRYGHPLGPFGLFALMTPELDMDKKMKQGKCKPKPTIPCEDIENETT